MTAISVQEIIRSYLANKAEKDWGGHDRVNTIGASGIGTCERKSWFDKNEIPGDPDYVERRGAAERGNIIENHLFVPAMRDFVGHLPIGVELLYAGEDQRTIVDGYLSATADALLVGVARDCLAWMGIPDIGPSRCLVIDCKSLDPRVDIKAAKAENVFQVQTQIGLLHACTPYRPEYALIPYIDASFLDDVTEFAVKYDPTIYAAAQMRARRIMTAVGPAALHPEGKMAGGNECKFCMYASHCADITVSSIPANSEPTLPALDAGILGELASEVDGLGEGIDKLTRRQAEVKQEIKDFLVNHGIRRYHNSEFSVSWSSAKGRELVDLAALEAAGVIDLDPFRKTGNVSDRLVVKVK